jgi:acetylornithine deacetylase
VKTVTECHTKTFGKKPVMQGVTYGSDLRLFTNHGGVPAVLYGPGDIMKAHTVDEFVELEEVFAAARVLAWLITQWCGGDVV